MKNKIFLGITRCVVGLMAVTFVAACSDGQFAGAPKVLTSLVPPAIAKLQISKVGAPETAGKSVTIAAGDAVLLEWEIVIGGGAAEEGSDAEVAPKGDDVTADESEAVVPGPSITIESAELGIKLENLDAVGSQVIENVTVDSKFVLIASDGINPAVSSEVSAIVSGYIDESLVDFWAEPAQIAKGQTADLCWTIADPDAEFEIVDSNGISILSSSEVPLEEVEEEAVEETDGEGTEGMTASGKAVSLDEGGDELEPVEDDYNYAECITVMPDATTTYYMTVTTAGGETVEKDATVEVTEALSLVYFHVKPEEIETATDVVVSWKVEPADAKVAVSNIGTDLGAEGSEIVNVGETTTFELAATLGDQSIKEIRTVTLVASTLPAGGIAVNVGGDAVIFAGEEAEISWEVVDVKGLPVPNASVIITGGVFGETGQQQAASGSVSVSPQSTIEYTITASVDSIFSRPEQVKIVVRNWKGPGAESINAGPITAVGTSPLLPDVVYVGFDGKLAGGGLTLAKGIGSGPVWSVVSLPYMTVVPPIDKNGGNNAKFFDDFEYPVNSITIDPGNADRIFLATTGGVFMSTDAGGSWSMLVGILLDNDIGLPHATCFGKEHPGWPDSRFHGLGQVCDIAVTSEGRFIIATDTVVEYLPNGVDAYQEDKSNNNWQGFETITYGQVNHDLEIANLAGQEILFVGTDTGILRSTDLGESYEQFGGAGAPTGAVYAIEVDEVKSVLYAGGADGTIYTCALKGLECTAWSNQIVGSGEMATVYSITVDPVKAGGAFAATGRGVYYTSDSLSWKDVTSGAMDNGVTVMSLAGVQSKNGEKGIVYAGTAQGVFISESDVIDGAGCATCPDKLSQPEEESAEELPVEETTTTTATGTMSGIL